MFYCAGTNSLEFLLVKQHKNACNVTGVTWEWSEEAEEDARNVYGVTNSNNLVTRYKTKLRM